MKFALQWQIILGIVIGVLFGIFSPTAYKITDKTISEIQKKNFPPELVQILQDQRKEYQETETEFIKRIRPAIGSEYFDKYKTEILIQAKYNPYLSYVSWLGDLFLRILAMVIVPLVISAIISGLSGIGGAKNLGRLGLKTIFYYITSSTLAILVGLFFVNIIKPGYGYDVNIVNKVDSIFTGYSFKESIMDIVPTNVFDAFAGTNMIAVIFFSILFGYFATLANDRSRIVVGNFFNASFEVLMQITNFIIKLIPLGLIGIVASFVADQAGDLEKLSNLYVNYGKYILTVIFAFAFHAIITLPLLMYFGFKASPWKVFLKVRSALVTAFFTSSSLTTLPITIHSVNKGCGVSNKVACFTLPLGATISMDGTALYQLIAVFFVAQAYGMELSFVETIVIIATTIITSVASSSIPMSGLYIMTVVLTTVGLPLEGVGMLLIIDLPLKMFRALVSVWSDSCGAVLIAKSEGEELKV
jgi:proton glutamate symport protein